MRLFVLLGMAVLIAGCHGKTFNVSKGKSRLVEADHRAIVSVKRKVLGSDGQQRFDDHGKPVASVAVCAEPSPDALQSTALTLGGEASAEVVDAVLKGFFVERETQEYVGLRTQTIQLLRDAYFRLCEAFLNDGIDAIAYDVLQRRFQSQIVALLAVEQLTGAVTAERRGASGNRSTQLARIADALDQSENALRDLKQKLEDEKAALDALEATRDGAKAAIEDAQRTLATIKRQIERRQQVIRALKESFVKAAQAAGNRDSAEPANATTAASSRSPARATDGRRGRYVKDGYYGAMEHAAFGAGIQRVADWEGEDGGLLERRIAGTGFQGELTGSRPAGNAVWEGRMVGYRSGVRRGEDPFVQGDARVSVSLSQSEVDIDFTKIGSMDRARAVTDFGFEDIPLRADGSFAAFDDGNVEGAFFGPAHEEAAGMFQHNVNRIVGSFGAVRKDGR